MKNTKCHQNVDCSSSDSEVCVQRDCDLKPGCIAPFRTLNGKVFDVSTLKCSSSDCGDGADALCDSDTMTSCPTIEHCVKKNKKHARGYKNRKENCGDCGHKKCRCDSRSNNWSTLLCGDSSDSDCSDKCEVNVPVAPCNVVKNKYWEASCRSNSSESSSDCENDNKYKKLNKPVANKPVANKNSDECAKCCYPKKYCRCVQGRKFEIMLGSKVGHPWEHRIMGNRAFIVNGVAGKAIHVTRGHTYKFNVKGLDGNRFYLTHDVQGGMKGVQADSPNFDPVKLPGTHDPMANGEFELNVTHDFPKMFYYQSRDNNCLGGMFFVHEK